MENNEHKKILLLVDNATCHKTNAIKSWAYEHGVKILFNIPYFARANPIELFFGDLKRRCRIDNISDHKSLAYEITKKIRLIPSKNYQSYFRKAF